MELNYTGSEAISLLKIVFKTNFETTLLVYKDRINALTLVYNCSRSDALKIYLKKKPSRIDAIYMLAALQTLRNEERAERLNLIINIKKFEDEKKQLAHQLFYLESSTVISDKNELRKIYQEQIQYKTKQIQQYNNAFNAVNSLRETNRING